jgi:carboxypeptidase Q
MNPEKANQDQANKIIAQAMQDETGYRRLEYLCDRIGARLSGSKSLNDAIAWAMAAMKADGLDAVHTEKVMVPHWVRGKESAGLLTPRKVPFSMLGIGNSVGTNGKPLRAEVMVVGSFDELNARSSEAKGKTVCFNVPFTGYGPTVQYRTNGASAAAKHGAVGVFVRSVGPNSLRTPHTGMLKYSDDAPKIPAAAITIEDAELLARLQASGQKITAELRMEAKTLPDAPSANVVADLLGREKPEEIVLLGGHLDSWDVGQGAHDDGGGAIACWEAVRLLKSLNFRPRRTLRIVLFTNEENGLRGGNAYAETHANDKHFAAIEADSGVTAPVGFGILHPDKAQHAAWKTLLTPLLAPLGADKIGDSGGGADIGPLGAKGVPTIGLNVDMRIYWDIHHTHADTFDKVIKDEFQKCVAALAILAYALGES